MPNKDRNIPKRRFKAFENAVPKRDDFYTLRVE